MKVVVIGKERFEGGVIYSLDDCRMRRRQRGGLGDQFGNLDRFFFKQWGKGCGLSILILNFIDFEVIGYFFFLVGFMGKDDSFSFRYDELVGFWGI